VKRKVLSVKVKDTYSKHCVLESYYLANQWNGMHCFKL